VTENHKFENRALFVASAEGRRCDLVSGAEPAAPNCVAAQTPCDLKQLYAEHGPGIRAHCGRLLGDSASAEDATHEVFLRVGRFGGRLPDASEMRPWLYRIATNHCLNELRSRGVRARTPPQLTGTATANLEDSMAARNDARRFLERLPPRARAIAWLTYVDGMLQQEVAETLGVSRRTVVNYLNQVRSRLHQSSRSELAMAR
jgi:RNA polymerase sigma-70 factor (ECF subfamily)